MKCNQSRPGFELESPCSLALVSWSSTPRVFCKLFCIVICWFMQKYTYICWIHTDAMNNRRRKTSLTIFTSHFICRGSKGLFKVCMWEGVGDRTETSIFWPHCYDRLVVSFSFLDAQLEVLGSTLLGAGFFIASYQHLLWTSTHQGQKAPSAWCGFPYHISSPTVCNSTGTRTVSASASPNSTGRNSDCPPDSNSTELNNNSTPTRSPTGSLKSNV